MPAREDLVIADAGVAPVGGGTDAGAAGPKPAAPRDSGRWLRSDRDLQDAVHPVAEEPVGLLDVLQREVVRDQWRWIEPA